jgi:peptidyl-prolyl cis-trans isomerase A (cyclophilin A)
MTAHSSNPRALHRLALALLLLPGAALAQAHEASAKAEPQPTGPVVVIDTTLGRLTCRLFSQQAPATAANFAALASGSKDWTDASTGAVMHAKPFYDAASFFGIADGITAGDRLGGNKGVAGDPFPAEKSGLGFDRAGRLIMARIQPASPAEKSAPEMTSSSVFYITTHADQEFSRRGGTCWPATIIPLIRWASTTSPCSRPAIRCRPSPPRFRPLP